MTKAAPKPLTQSKIAVNDHVFLTMESSPSHDKNVSSVIFYAYVSKVQYKGMAHKRMHACTNSMKCISPHVAIN